MKEFFEILGTVSGDRLLGYTILFVIIIAVTLNGITEIIKALKRKN